MAAQRTEETRSALEPGSPAIREPTPAERAQWIEEFEAAARRPLRIRFRYAFLKTYKPVLDDAQYRSFDTTAEYRRWCEVNLPAWLGYGRAL
jgi:hypothetical protein